VLEPGRVLDAAVVLVERAQASPALARRHFFGLNREDVVRGRGHSWVDCDRSPGTEHC